MPALLILAVISWLFGSGKTRTNAGTPGLFTALEVRPTRRWSAFFTSLAVHAVCLTFVFIFSDIFSTPDDDFVPRRMARQSLVINLPDRIDVATANDRTTASNEEAQKPKVAVRRKDLRKYTEGGAEAKSVEPPSPRLADTSETLLSMMKQPPLPKYEPKKFELPDLPVRETKTQTLLQPDVPPDLAPPVDKKLPQIILWASEKLKAPPLQLPIQPGNRTARLEAPKLDAPPRLEASNLESRAADIRIASALAVRPSPFSPPPSTTVPMRLLEQAANQAGGPSSIDPFTGQPVQVIALSPEPPQLADALKALLIPPGNQLARLPGASPFGAIPGLGDGGTNGGSSGDGNGSNKGALAGADGSAFALALPPGFKGAPLRVIHPNNGVFDIVVMQSSSADAFPQGADLLSGRPIYTVYLQVGGRKEWVLQYCIPNAPGPIQTENIVQLGKPAPIRAPYPMVTVRPPEDWRHGEDYLLVHGFLDAAGRFRNLQAIVNEQVPEGSAEALLQYLAYWEFRPAVQDGRPVMVEVIIGVPPDSRHVAVGPHFGPLENPAVEAGAGSGLDVFSERMRAH